MSQLKKELERLPARRLLAGILWRLLLPLAIVWFWQIFFHTKDTKDTTVSPSRAVFDSIAFFLIPAFLVMASKLYLFERYSRRYSYYRKLLDSPAVVSLPSISAVVNQLETRITSSSLLQESRILAIEAEWGNGKTRVLRELQDRFLQDTHANSTDDDETQTVMIMVDIWSFTNHLDLQFALLEELLSHPLVPAPVIRRGPFSLRFWNHNITLVPLIFLRFLLGAGKFVLKTSHVDFTVQQTEGLWYYLLRTIVDKLRSQNIRVVWCLDEIDRSSPEVAQQAILLTKRFLNHPGTTIVLPYVKNSMYWKVFNPLLCKQPDLQYTMLQILIDEKDHFRNASSENYSRYFWAGTERHVYTESASALAQTHKSNCCDCEDITQRIESRLLEATSALTVDEYMFLANSASEKFLQQSMVRLERPSHADVSVLLNDTQSILTTELRQRLFGKADFRFDGDVVKKILLSPPPPNTGSLEPPGLRQFISSAERLISAISNNELFLNQLQYQNETIAEQRNKERAKRILELVKLCFIYSSSDTEYYS